MLAKILVMQAIRVVQKLSVCYTHAILEKSYNLGEFVYDTRVSINIIQISVSCSSIITQ